MNVQQFANLSQRDLILFDLDGTLVDSAKDLYRAMNLTLAELHRPAVTEQQIRTWIGRGAGQLCECVILHQDGILNPQQHHILLQRFLQIYEQNVCVETEIYAGVLDFLNACQAQDKTLAVVTNKPYAPTQALLHSLNLNDYFQLVIGGDSLTERKPSPRPLLHAVEHFQQRRERTLMIGDSRNDVESARSAQIDCIMLSYGYNHGEPLIACKPQCIIHNLNELLSNS